jgi:hypothetical protein
VEWCVTSMEAWLLKQEHLKNYVIAWQSFGGQKITEAKDWDFCSAASKLIEEFEKGVDEIPALPDLITKMSREIGRDRKKLWKKRKDAMKS